MACGGSSGCVCVCRCSVPRAHYGFGIYEAWDAIPPASSFLPVRPEVTAGAETAFGEVRAHEVLGTTAPPGLAGGTTIREWGRRRPLSAFSAFGGGRDDVLGKKREESFLSPPAMEAMRERPPGPVLHAPTTKTVGPRKESLAGEGLPWSPTYDIGDPTGAIQTPSGQSATALAVAPPDSRTGVQPPTPWGREAMAPPHSGEFLQGALLGPGAGIGSEGSDPLEDNGRYAPMDSVVAEEAFPEEEQAEEPVPVEPGDEPRRQSPSSLRPPDFPGHPATAPVPGTERGPQAKMGPQDLGIEPTSWLRRTTPPPSLPGAPAAGAGVGGSFRPQVTVKPSVRPSFGFAHGRSNPAFSAAVDARVREMYVRDAKSEAAAEREKAEKRGDEEGIRLANMKIEELREEEREARREGDFADRAAGAAAPAAARSMAKRVWEEAIRRHDREESKLVKLSAGSGDVGAARDAQARIGAALAQRDRATAMSAQVASARQGDRVREADARTRDAAETLRAAEARAADKDKNPIKQDLKYADVRAAREELKRTKNTSERTRREARSPKARQAYRKQKEVARRAAKAARRASRESRKAARRLKNAVRYGPKAAVDRARKDAEAKKEAADKLMETAEKEAKKLLDPDEPLVPEAESAPGVVDCTCSPSCPAYAKCLCQCLLPEGEGPEAGEKKAGRGRFRPQEGVVAPPDSGVGSSKVEEAFKISEEVRERKEKERAEGGDGEEEVSTAQPAKPEPPKPPPKKKPPKPPRQPTRKERDWRPPLPPVVPQDSELPRRDSSIEDELRATEEALALERARKEHLDRLRSLEEQEKKLHKVMSSEVSLSKIRASSGHSLKDRGVVVFPYARTVQGTTKSVEEFSKELSKVLSKYSYVLGRQVFRILVEGDTNAFGQKWEGRAWTIKRPGGGITIYEAYVTRRSDGRWMLNTEMVSIVVQKGKGLPAIPLVHEDGHRGAIAFVFNIFARAYPSGFATMREAEEAKGRMKDEIIRLTYTGYHDDVLGDAPDQDPYSPFILTPQEVYGRISVWHTLFDSPLESGILLRKYLREIGKSSKMYHNEDGWYVQRGTVKRRFPWVRYLEYDESGAPYLEVSGQSVGE